MTAADRCQAAAIVTGGLAVATDATGLWYLTAALLWAAIVNLTGTIRDTRRQQRKDVQR
jgi:hypothetical protein